MNKIFNNNTNCDWKLMTVVHVLVCSNKFGKIWSRIYSTILLYYKAKLFNWTTLTQTCPIIPIHTGSM